MWLIKPIFNFIVINYFNILIIHCSFLQTTIESITKNDDAIINYTNWLTDIFPFANNKDVNGSKLINCINTIIKNDFNDFIDNIDSQKSNRNKLIFLNNFLKRITKMNSFDLKIQDKFSRAVENVACNLYLLINLDNFQINLHNLFETITKWNLLKKFNYFLILLPNTIVNGDRHYNEQDVLATLNLWPISKIFTHSNVILIYNWQIFKLSTPYSRHGRHFSEISVDELMDWHQNNYEINHIHDFNGKQLTVCTLDCPPHNYWQYKKDKERSIFPKIGDTEVMCQYKSYLPNYGVNNCKQPEGMESFFMTIISEKLNFSWNIYFPLAGEYGTPQPDGTEDGMIGEVMLGRADMAYCMLWVQYPRNTKIDFTYGFFETCITFLVPRPSPLPIKWYSIFRGFSNHLWTFLLSFFFFILFVGWSIGKLSNHLLKYSENRAGSVQIFFTLVGILTTANSVPASSIPGFTMLLTAWSLFCCFMIMVYSSDLSSFLSVPRYSIRIDSSEDFAATNLTWGLFRHTDFEFLNLERQDHQTIRNNFQYESNSNEEAVTKQVNKGNYAVAVISFADGSATVWLGINEFPYQKLRLMRSCLYRPFTGFAFPNNSPFKEAVDKILVQMFETGIVHHIKKDTILKHYPQAWQSIFAENDFISNSPPVVLTLKHIYGVFYVLIVGLSMASAIFVAELVHFKMELIRFKQGHVRPKRK